MLTEIIQRTRAANPLIHCLSNHVTSNDCANILLACGASPIMGDDPDEAGEIAGMCGGVVLNMGTPSHRKTAAMLAAGQTANRLQRPVVLDPVGVGCTAMRKSIMQQMIGQIRFAAIRGNAGEIAVLSQSGGASRGVDAGADCIASGNAVSGAARLARDLQCVVIVSGSEDVVTDGRTTFRVFNGHPMMRSVTGMGCQLSALTGAFMAANPEKPLEAALAAVCAMGLCGEIAHSRLSAADGNATFRNYVIDAVYRLTPEALEKGAKYEIVR